MNTNMPEITEEQKQAILKRIREAEIPPEHFEKMCKKEREMNEKFERIAKAQTPSWEDINRPFDI